MLTALDVADWIVRFRAAAPVDPLSLQKLLFYAQAFHLARFGEPLFRDEFQASTDGPVVREVWRVYKESSGPLLPNGFTLSEATHKEEPWLNAHRGYAPREPSATVISTDDIRSYYAGLLWDGEEALSRPELLDDLPEPRVGSFYRGGICVRGMRNHPFYTPKWAMSLSRPVPADSQFPRELLEPIKERKYIRARDL